MAGTWDEDDYLRDFLRSQREQYKLEVPAGNQLCAERLEKSSFAGPASLSIDAVVEDEEETTPEIIEAKVGPTHRALGQLLLGSRLYARDREIVTSRYKDRNSPWKSKRRISGFETHVRKRMSTSGRYTYHPKYLAQEPTLTLVTGPVTPTDTVLLSGFSSHDIDLIYRESNTWRKLDKNHFSAATSEHDLRQWIRDHSRSELDSDAEEELASGFIDVLTAVFTDVNVFREVPIGRVGYPSAPSNLFADLVLETDGGWIVAEVKCSSTDCSTRDFETAYGQAVGYATIFRQEWGLERNSVVPAVVQSPIPLIGACYREDRYQDDENLLEMVSVAQTDTTQPVIFGPAETIG